MTTIDFITDLFCRIDDRMKALPKHPQAMLWPSEVVTLGGVARPQGGRQPRFLSLADAGLPTVVSSPARTDPVVSVKRHRKLTRWRHRKLTPLVNTVIPFTIKFYYNHSLFN